MNRKIIITPEGYSTLQKKIVRLEKDKQKLAERLGLTSLDSDLSENSDFLVLDAKNMNLLKEIEENKSYLEKAEIHEKSNNKTFIGLGSIVIYSRLDKKEKLTVELTDDIAAAPPRQISVNSPFGEKLLGKKVGDTIRQGKNKYQILEIK